jgi:putative ABC transport system permease protein
MRIPLAWLNLLHAKSRTALAVAGVAFAVVLIFMQLGFLGSARKSATLFFEALDFDLLIRSRNYLHLISSRTFPRERLDEAASQPQTARASAVYLVSDFWRNPNDGSKRAMLIIGVDPAAPIFLNNEIQQKLSRLTVPEFVLVDSRSRREFGPRDGRRFGPEDVGTEGELARQKVKIVDYFTLGTGFVADGAALTGIRGFQRFRPRQAPGEVSLGLVKLREGVDPLSAAAALEDALPDDVEVLTRDAALGHEVNHWVWETSIGLIFQLGVVVAMVVGTAIVYQVLSSDVANHLHEYATLKAIGYGGGYLAGVVLRQALALAVLGFVPGLLVSAALYWLTRTMASVPIHMSLGLAAFVFALAVAMCSISGLGALRKLRSADPADLF